MKFYDSNCWFGSRGIVNPGSFYKKEDLLDAMNRYNIDWALVYHSYARENNPKTGNICLMDEINNLPLTPKWVIMPNHCDEFYSPDDLMKEMKKKNVRAVAMFNGAGEQNFSLSEWSCGTIFDMLTQYKIPLFLDVAQLPNWDVLYNVMQNHENMPVILINTGYRVNRYLFPLMDRFKSIFVESSGYNAFNGIEQLCKRFGSDRVVFGSGMPVYSGASAVSSILMSSISSIEKEKIASENIKKLLERSLS